MPASVARKFGKAALAVGFALGLAASPVAQAKDSGFLKEYSQLKPETDAAGVERRVWTSPKFARPAYDKLLVEPVVFYPEPQPTKQVPARDLKEMREYLDATIRRLLTGVVQLADAPGPGVARVRVAVTATEAGGASLKPYQLLPIAMVVTAASKAARGPQHDVKLSVELDVTDSVSGEPLARAVRPAKGIEVEGGQQLTLALAKPRIDQWAETVRASIAARMKQAGR
jgi:hypothetical protein